MALKSIVDIARILYAEPVGSVALASAGLTGTEVKAIMDDSGTKEVVNVHGDTWAYEEEEGTTTPFRNQLNGNTYYNDYQPGSTSVSFSIGQYDYATKASLQGGTATATSWERPKSSTIIYKCVIAVTKDDTYLVFPKAQIVARGGMIESKLIGLMLSATPVETGVTGLAPEKWFDSSEIV
jgi:hypothetical protein